MTETARIVVDEQRGVIIGATFTGTDVAEWLHAATIAIVAKTPVELLWQAVPAFPTRSEIWLKLLERREADRPINHAASWPTPMPAAQPPAQPDQPATRPYPSPSIPWAGHAKANRPPVTVLASGRSPGCRGPRPPGRASQTSCMELGKETITIASHNPNKGELRWNRQ